jgi:hypothetical protein
MMQNQSFLIVIFIYVTELNTILELRSQSLEYYPGAEEPIPPNLNKVMRHSQAGLILYVNRAQIIPFSVESATFSSELITLKTAIFQVDALT